MSDQQAAAIVILGGGGDLAQRKLIPALFNLYTQKLLPPTFSIIGFARTKRTNDEYRSFVKDALLKDARKISKVSLDTFCEHITYVDGSFDSTAGYRTLASALCTFEQAQNAPANRLFYLAVPPEHYESIFRNLHENALADASTHEGAWSKILVEKPFGSNYASAQHLEEVLSSLYRETQIFRIDHYLAKEAVQNILSFRFANTILRSLWNRDHIEEVRITMHESLTAQTRGSFYDGVGALRDVGQNHLLQILALIAMDEPETFSAEHIRANRAAILQKLIPATSQSIHKQVVRAQYEGYTETAGVSASSQTETYFEFKAYIDTDAWRNVPFCISAGKGLKNDQVVVEIIFKEIPEGPFRMHQNSITLTVSPVQSMNITLNVKKPGYGYEIESDTLSYAWDEVTNVNAYEKVLLDCIEGDQTLFTHTHEVLASWKFITSIMEHWGNVPLQRYSQGSVGPLVSMCKR